MPRREDIDWTGLPDFPEDRFHDLQTVDRESWKNEVSSHESLFSKLYDKLPKEFFYTRELILSALWRSPEEWSLAHERP
jgi:phosphoenolpyruvate carboxykinase (GTP)